MAKTGTRSEQILDKSIKSEDFDSDLHLSGSTFLTGSLLISSSDAYVSASSLIASSINLNGEVIDDWGDITEEEENNSNILEKKFFAGDDAAHDDIVRTDNNSFSIATSASNFTPDHYRFVLNDNGVWNTMQVGVLSTYSVPTEDRVDGIYRYIVMGSSTSSLETHIDYCTVTIKDS